jgi:hypothetical protein
MTKLERDRLQAIIDGAKATRQEVDAMASELLVHREEEAKRDDGTVAVTIEHAGSEGITGWFATRKGRIPRAVFHVGARFTMSGRVYGILSIDGDHVRVR